MKIAILSDIHGNWPALQAVMAHIDGWQPDQVVVNGDIVNGGPSNPTCWQALQTRQRADSWHLQRGNHEDYVIEWADMTIPRSGPRFDINHSSFWTFNQLNGEVADLAVLPDRFGHQVMNGSRMMITHASVWGNRDGMLSSMSDAELRRRIVPAPEVFVTSHTHEAFIRQVDQTLLLNTGSVGLPCDGDWRASYGQLSWSAVRGWRAKIVRVAYDRDQAVRDFVTSGYLDGGGIGARLVFYELQTARDAVGRWSAIYLDAVLAGEIDGETAVNKFLSAA